MAVVVSRLWNNNSYIGRNLVYCMAKGRTCEDFYAPKGRQAAGFAYANYQHHFFGDDSLILVGEGEGGKDLAFAATSNWLRGNFPSTRFDLSQDDQNDVRNHLLSCESLPCQESFDRMVQVAPYVSGRKSFSDALLATSIFQSRMGYDPLVLRREDGFGDEIDTLKPFFKWFEKEKGLWLWPKARIVPSGGTAIELVQYDDE